MQKHIKNRVCPTDDPLTIAETIVRGAFAATIGMPEKERIERLIYSIAAVFRDNPLPIEDVPTFYLKMNPDKKSSYARIAGDKIEVAAMLAKHMKEPFVN